MLVTLSCHICLSRGKGNLEYRIDKRNYHNHKQTGTNFPKPPGNEPEIALEGLAPALQQPLSRNGPPSVGIEGTRFLSSLPLSPPPGLEGRIGQMKSFYILNLSLVG